MLENAVIPYQNVTWRLYLQELMAWAKVATPPTEYGASTAACTSTFKTNTAMAQTYISANGLTKSASACQALSTTKTLKQLKIPSNTSNTANLPNTNENNFANYLTKSE
jgi:hypothetical protein